MNCEAVQPRAIAKQVQHAGTTNGALCTRLCVQTLGSPGIQVTPVLRTPVCNWAHSEEELGKGPGQAAWAAGAEAAWATGAEAAAPEAEWNQQAEWYQQEQQEPPAKAEQSAAARSVLLGEEVQAKLRLLNSEGQLQTPIDVDAVVGPLSQLDTETALEILESLHERGHQVDDPTEWVVEASGAIPEEKPWAEEEPAEVVIPDEEEKEANLELLGIENPAKRRRTSSGAEAGEEAEGENGEAQEAAAGEGQGKEAAAAPAQPPAPQAPQPALRPAAPQPPGKACGKGWNMQPSAPSAPWAGTWRPRMYKTNLCRRFQSGYCPSGPSCNWAHGVEDIRPVPGAPGPVPAAAQQYRPPAAWAQPRPPGAVVPARVISPPVSPQIGLVSAGDADSISDQQFQQQMRLARMQKAFAARPYEDATTIKAGQELTMEQICNYKTRLCPKFTMGYCLAGDNCILAHGKDELQQPWQVPTENQAEDEALDDEEGEEEGPAEEEVPAEEEEPAAEEPAAEEPADAPEAKEAETAEEAEAPGAAEAPAEAEKPAVNGYEE